MRLVIARCSVDYTGRLNAHLPLATRLLVHKGDGSLLVHSDGGSYKPLNWMSPPCRLDVETPDESDAADGVVQWWRVTQQRHITPAAQPHHANQPRIGSSGPTGT